MKSILRHIIFYSISLYIVSQLFSGLKITGGIQTIFISGALFTGLSMVLGPILKIITLPLTIVTLGLFSFVINAIILYILTIIISDVHVSAFIIEKVRYDHFVIPTIHVNIILAFVFLSAIISALVGLLTWLTE